MDGMVLSALIVPDAEMGLTHSIAVEQKMYDDGIIAANKAVRGRADRIYGELTWTHDKKIFGRVPTKVVVGELDPFQTPQAWNLYRSWAAESPDTVELISVQGGAHGVLGPIANRPDSTQVVKDGIRSIIERARAKAENGATASTETKASNAD